VKKQIARIAAIATIGGLSAGSALALDVTANAGAVSEYVFRGVPSSDGKAAAQGGLDAAWDSGFYLGTWGSSVDFGSSHVVNLDAEPGEKVVHSGSDGVEVDFYGGYGGEIGDFSYGIGATLYTYTDDADDDYTEINLSAGWKWFSVAYANGEYDDPGGVQYYDFYSITAEYEGLYATFGSFGDDFDGDYYEFGYGSTLTVGDEDLFDYSIVFIDSDAELGGASENRLVFGVTKSFDINL
jgi:uncharacterized protein (TIGR02001 family)